MGDLGRPFRGGEALSRNLLTRRELAREYRAVFPGVYLHRGIALTSRFKAEAAWQWSRRRATMVGMSAAVGHGAKWVDADLPAEIVHTNRRAPAQIMVRRYDLHPDEIVRYGAIAMTTVARTAFDLARRLDLDEAVRRVDALLNAQWPRPVPIAEIAAVAARHCRCHGASRVAEVLDLVDAGAESPPETDTRLCLIRGGLPRPRTQLVVHTEYGTVDTARIDMAYLDYRVGVEYDGGQHWSDRAQRAADIDRYEALEDLGWRMVRVGADLLASRKPEIVSRVRAALVAQGWRAGN